MEIADWWFKSLVDLLFKKLFVTNIFNLISTIILGISFLYIIATSIWFYKSMGSKYTKEQEKKREGLIKDIRLKEHYISGKWGDILDTEPKIDEWMSTMKRMRTPGDGSPAPFSQPVSNSECLQHINKFNADIDSFKRDIIEATEYIEKCEKEVSEIQKTEVKHDVFVKAQSDHISKANAIIKISGILLFVGTLFQYIFFEEFSLSFTQVAGIAFMVVYGLSFNLKELTKNLKTVVLLGAHQFDPSVYHPSTPGNVDQNPLPDVKPLPPQKMSAVKPSAIQIQSSTSTPSTDRKTLDDRLREGTDRMKRARKERESLTTPPSNIPDGVLIRIDYDVIDEKTYLQVVSSTQKVFANLKMNGKRFLLMASIHVLIPMLYDVGQYNRILDVIIVFILAQFASLWIFKKHVRIDSFTGRFSNAFSVFLYKEFEKAFLLHGPAVPSIEKLKIAKHLLQYLQFVVGMQLKVRIENPGEVTQQIIAKYLDKTSAGGFSVFISGLPERDSIRMLRDLPIHPSRSRYSLADMLKIVAGVFSAVYGFLQIIKLLGTA